MAGKTNKSVRPFFTEIVFRISVYWREKLHENNNSVTLIFETLEQAYPKVKNTKTLFILIQTFERFRNEIVHRMAVGIIKVRQQRDQVQSNEMVYNSS